LWNSGEKVNGNEKSGKEGEEKQKVENKNIAKWTVKEVADWIENIGFKEFRQNFEENLVDGATLIELESQELKDDLGVSAFGARKQILRAVQNILHPESASDDP